MARLFVLLLLLLFGLPVLMVGCLRQQPPLITAFMLQSDVKPVHYEWVPAENIAEVVHKAVIASEDQKFWKHSGFDFQAMEQAHRENQKRSRKRGASTISQQTAKNLFLWPGGGYLRKGIEAYLTVLMELLWPKQRILEVYLNIVELAPGVYGVEAAAQKIFGKPASDLTASEAAQLAAVLPNPNRLSAARPTPYVMARTAWILRQMGYGLRPVATADPEPKDPEADAPGGDEPEYAETVEDQQPLDEDESIEIPPIDDAEMDVNDMEDEEQNPQDAPVSGQRGGGSVIDEQPDEEARELEQSLIL